jgi:hypothetical protein
MEAGQDSTNTMQEGAMTIHAPKGENIDWYLEWFHLFGFFW